MKKRMDKLVNEIKVSKKMLLFLFVLGLIAIIVGTIFVIVLKDSDQILVEKYLASFFNKIKNNNLNYIYALKNVSINNYFFILAIWLLGISIVGIPIIIFGYFMKCFVLGFSLTSILLNYKFKGIILSFIYIFPHHVINFLIYIVLISYSLTVSLKLIDAIIKKKNINFRLIINKYFLIFILSFILITLTNLFEVYVTPLLIKYFINLT